MQRAASLGVVVLVLVCGLGCSGELAAPDSPDAGDADVTKDARTLGSAPIPPEWMYGDGGDAGADAGPDAASE